MSNPFKVGDTFTFKDGCLHYHTYRDCSSGTTYTVVTTGMDFTRQQPDAVEFADDVGDTVCTTYEHLLLNKQHADE